MNTLVSDWQIVTIIDKNEQAIGDVLFCKCINDTRNLFSLGSYICTSRITDLNADLHLIKTYSGTLYQLLGAGKRSTIELRYFPLLRQGFSPEQINALKSVSPSTVH